MERKSLGAMLNMASSSGGKGAGVPGEGREAHSARAKGQRWREGQHSHQMNKTRKIEGWRAEKTGSRKEDGKVKT